MMGSKNKLLSRFVKFGRVSSKREREKMADIIKEWKPIAVENSNIDKRYLTIINSFITDDKIGNTLLEYPSLKDELTKQLLDLLGKIDADVEDQSRNKTEHKYLKEFENLTAEAFESNLLSKENKFKKLISKKYVEEELSFDALQAEYENEITQSKKRIRKIEKENEALIKEIESCQKEVASNKNAIAETDNNGLKIIGKIDLTSNNKVVYKSPKELEIEEIQQANLALKAKIEKCENQIKLNIKNNKTAKPNLNRLQNDFTVNWKKKLSLKEIQHQVEIIDKSRMQFLKDLYEKIEQLKELLKLLSPFILETTNYGRLWDLSASKWKKVNFDLLDKYAQILKEKKDIQELAELLGRYRKAETELEEEEFEELISISKYKIEHFGKTELVGVTESDDLNNMLPAELVLFSDLETENIFYKRYAEKKLQTFQYINKEKDYSQKGNKGQRKKETKKDKGPFILAIDTSGSMHGEPEFLAKVISFAITQIALREDRKAFLISFSTGFETIELTDIHDSIEKLIEFLQMSFRGGTDATGAVKEALTQMNTEAYKQADLLIISDGVFGNLDDTILENIEALKKEGNKFNSLMIGNSYNEKALDFCDNVWQYDPMYDGLKDLLRKMKNSLAT